MTELVATTPPPSMATQADVDCVRKAVSGLAQGSVVVEFGPWLGALSVELAKNVDLHVVDVFKWTQDHNKKVPNLIDPGDSFRPLFERTMADHDVSATVHETEFETFSWGGDPIDMIVIDGPKNPLKVKQCLQRCLPHLKSDGLILLKPGLNPQYYDLCLYLERLVDHGVIRIPDQTAAKACTFIQLKPGPNVAELAVVSAAHRGQSNAFSLHDTVALAPDHSFQFSKVVAAAVLANWDVALGHLSMMSPNSKLAEAWEKIEVFLAKTTTDPAGLQKLSEMVDIQHRKTPSDELPVPYHESAEQALRGFWVNNARNDWRASSYHPDVISRAYAFGYMSWPSKIRRYTFGRDILDVGCGPGLHGIGYLAAGAKSYLGLDPILQPDRDRVKNLKAGGKEAFGWTPNQLSQMIPPWHASPEPIGDTSTERAFDLCTLHNVTEHLHMLEDIFADIALRLRRGGKILYNHHNFYCWNGHHLPPKTVSKLDMSDPRQLEMIDWGHVEYQPDPEHYIARGLNRIRLDEIIALTEKYFVIDEMEEIPSKPATGAGRLTDEIKAKYPYLEEREFTTQNLFCVATVR